VGQWNFNRKMKKYDYLIGGDNKNLALSLCEKLESMRSENVATISREMTADKILKLKHASRKRRTHMRLENLRRQMNEN